MKPILFATPMVQTILAGRKTSTRRVIKRQLGKKSVPIPPYQIGDVLWVRETWAFVPCDECLADVNYMCCQPEQRRVVDSNGQQMRGCYDYLADVPHLYCSHKWHPSIHMPRDAARLFLRVTGIRMESLCSISEADAVREGFSAGRIDITSDPWVTEDELSVWTAIEEFQQYWDNLSDRPEISWAADPLVWVIDFDVIPKSAAKMALVQQATNCDITIQLSGAGAPDTLT